MTHTIEQIAALLQSRTRILGITHYNPDGDAIGSLAALGHIAALLGKDVRLYCASPIPYFLDWLNLPSDLHNNFSTLAGWTPELIIFLDCADAQRAGQPTLDLLAGKLPHTGWATAETVSIDHHIGNTNFAVYNWIEPKCAATTEMTGLLAEALGLTLKGELGEAVYLGLVADSGNFSYGNTTPELLEMAARISRAGLDIGAFTEKYANVWTVARMRLWGSLMQELRLYGGNNIIMSVITAEHHKRYNTTPADMEGFVSWIRRVKGSKISALITEKRDGCKLSLRSSGSLDIRQTAEHFGGGGHLNAAGAEMNMRPEDAAKAVLQLLMPIVDLA